MGNQILVQTHNYELTSRLSALDLLHAFSTNLIIFLFSTFYVKERERDPSCWIASCFNQILFASCDLKQCKNHFCIPFSLVVIIIKFTMIKQKAIILFFAKFVYIHFTQNEIKISQ